MLRKQKEEVNLGRLSLPLKLNSVVLHFIARNSFFKKIKRIYLIYKETKGYL